MYLPLATIVIAAVLAARSALNRIGAAWPGVWRRTAAGVLLAGIVTSCTLATADRNRDYRSGLRLWEDAVAKRPGDVRARTNLGVALGENGRPEEAEREFRAALDICPGHPPALAGLGNTYAERGQWIQAIDSLRTALRNRPDYAAARTLLVRTLTAAGREMTGRGLVAEGISRLEEAVRLAPDDASARNGLGFALSRTGAFAEAEPHFRRAIELDPGLADAHKNLGFTLVALGREPEGIGHIEEGLRLEPDARAHLLLGDILAQSGRDGDAAIHYNEALRIDPGLQDARQRLRDVGGR